MHYLILGILIFSCSSSYAYRFCSRANESINLAILMEAEVWQNGGEGTLSVGGRSRETSGWYHLKSGECTEELKPGEGRFRAIYYVAQGANSRVLYEPNNKDSVAACIKPREGFHFHYPAAETPQNCQEEGGEITYYSKAPSGDSMTFSALPAERRSEPRPVERSKPKREASPEPVMTPAEPSSSSPPAYTPPPYRLPAHTAPVDLSSNVTYTNRSAVIVNFALAAWINNNWTTVGWFTLVPGQSIRMLAYSQGAGRLFVHANYVRPENGEKVVAPANDAVMCVDPGGRFRIEYADQVPCNETPTQVRSGFQELIVRSGENSLTF